MNIHLNQALGVRLVTNAEHSLRFCLQVFCRAWPPQRVDCLAQPKIWVKFLSQGHNDAIPVREIEVAMRRVSDQKVTDSVNSNPSIFSQ